MTHIAAVNNPDNIVLFNKQKVAVLAKDGNYFYIVVGSDNDVTGDAFVALVNHKRNMVNYQGLRIWSSQALMAISSLNHTYTLESKLGDILKGKPCYMPSNFDFDKRCGIKMNGDRYLRQTDAAPFRYFKYHVSLIGNPKHILLVKMMSDDYKESEFYERFIAKTVKESV